ncbi:MAG: hypothetical protein FJ206_11110 [Gemmatimonadetes bacterium]|nr:hypothetical protein [Gemmatimonadota bacterium]
MPKVGVVGSLVWDQIHGRDPSEAPVEEWGGIAYALAGFDAALGSDWEVVPLVKVGRDLAVEADRFLRSLRHRSAEARFIEVATPNNRVVLRYQDAERRCERMSGGVPPWRWDELGPLVADLDAIYLNFISGFEMPLGTAQALRAGFRGALYADLHSLFFGMGFDGTRMLQPLLDPVGWFSAFDYIQMNEAEMRMVGPDPLAVATQAMSVGVRGLLVTVGARGTIYVAAPEPGSTVAARTALVPAPAVDAIDPTGCGDVFGATTFAHLLAGVPLEQAVALGNRAAARNAGYRGASGLVQHLRGSLVTP